MAFAQNTLLSATGAFVLSDRDYLALGFAMAKMGRVATLGKAKTQDAESRAGTLSEKDILAHWRLFR